MTPKAILDKLFFLESDCCQNFKAAITDSTFDISKKEWQLLFLHTLLDEETVTAAGLLEILKDLRFEAKDDLRKSILKTLAEKISSQVDMAVNKRQSNSVPADVTGNNLYAQTSGYLKQLEEICGEKDFAYSDMADKVAREILECSIFFFNHCRKEKPWDDYLSKAEKLAKMAQHIAVGGMIKDRINKSLKTLKTIKKKDIKRAITQAISLLKSVKKRFETNKAEITAEVKKQEATLTDGQSINWNVVIDMIEKSIDWDKVIAILQKKMPPHYMDKIRTMKNQDNISEYKSWLNF